MICYGRVTFYDHLQEHYDTASRDARARAKALRGAGMKVFVSSPSVQVTPVGIVRMTMLTAYTPNGEALFDVPIPDVVVCRL